MFDFVITCKHCGKEEIHGYHCIWEDRKICVSCREKMYERHKVLMDKILEKAIEAGRLPSPVMDE